MDKLRAKKGGEYGANGDFYKGGTFINTVADRPKGRTQSRRKKRKKIEIAPYVWEFPPTEKAVSLWSQLAGIYARYDRKTKTLVFDCLPETLAFYGSTEDEVKDLIAKWNAGDRWIENL